MPPPDWWTELRCDSVCPQRGHFGAGPDLVPLDHFRSRLLGRGLLAAFATPPPDWWTELRCDSVCPHRGHLGAGPDLVPLDHFRSRLPGRRLLAMFATPPPDWWTELRCDSVCPHRGHLGAGPDLVPLDHFRSRFAGPRTSRSVRNAVAGLVDRVALRLCLPAARALRGWARPRATRTFPPLCRAAKQPSRRPLRESASLVLKVGKILTKFLGRTRVDPWFAANAPRHRGTAVN
jgi:hypothetical protein